VAASPPRLGQNRPTSGSTSGVETSPTDDTTCWTRKWLRTGGLPHQGAV